MFQSLSPGLVKTEMPPKEFFEKMAALNPEDIADGVLYVLGTPPHVQVSQTFSTVTVTSHVAVISKSLTWLQRRSVCKTDTAFPKTPAAISYRREHRL